MIMKSILHPFWSLVFLPLRLVLGNDSNYSVQLMEGVAPSGWSAKQWTAAADTMIGKTQAYVLTDMIEDLGIKLKVTESHIREQIDADRMALGLGPLPPSEKKPGLLERLESYQEEEEPKEDLTQFLPRGWTEDKYYSHSEGDLAELSLEIASKVRERGIQEQEAADRNPNKGYLESLPQEVFDRITDYIHEQACKVERVNPGVRVYKRELAPLVQVVALQNVEEWGFLLYRTYYRNESAWEAFLEKLSDINESQLGNGFRGTGLDLVKDLFMMPLAAEGEVGEAAGTQACVDHFKSLRDQDAIPIGLDIGVIYMADEESIMSVVDFTMEKYPPFVWAIDVDYNPRKQEKYPEGYSGRFKVHTAALLHDLYVPLSSGLYAPVDIWKLLQAPRRVSPAAKKGHDEL